MLNIIFWGTPAYAVPSLEALVGAGHRIVGAVTQPDRRRGRGAALVPSAVKARALELQIPVFTPERIRRDQATQAKLASLGADLSVVVAFGQILPPEVLNQPPLGCWNGHGSLLPRWRGAAPIQWSLIEGDSHTGVGIMAMEAGLDTGPVLLERPLTIGLLDNAHQLGDRLASLTAELLAEATVMIEAAGPGAEAQRLARLAVKPQASTGVTYARLLNKDDLQLDWSQPALALHRRVMGLYPGACSSWRGKRLKLLATEPLIQRLSAELSPEVRPLLEPWGTTPSDPSNQASEPEPSRASPRAAAPGTVLGIAPQLGLIVATGGCPLLIREAQLEGKSPCEGARLLQQLAPQPGERLGDGPAQAVS